MCLYVTAKGCIYIYIYVEANRCVCSMPFLGPSTFHREQAHDLEANQAAELAFQTWEPATCRCGQGSRSDQHDSYCWGFEKLCYRCFFSLDLRGKLSCVNPAPRYKWIKDYDGWVVFLRVSWHCLWCGHEEMAFQQTRTACILALMDGPKSSWDEKHTKYCSLIYCTLKLRVQFT